MTVLSDPATASDGCLDFFFASENVRRRKRREKVNRRLCPRMAVWIRVIEKKKISGSGHKQHPQNREKSQHLQN